MFDPEEAIRNWRRQMTGQGIRNADLLNELESHLRDDVEQQVGSGLEAQQAFERATGRIGQADALKSEFAKFSRRKSITKRATLARRTTRSSVLLSTSGGMFFSKLLPMRSNA